VMMILLSLWMFNYIEKLLPTPMQRVVTVRMAYEPGDFAKAEGLCREAGLIVEHTSFDRSGDLASTDVHVAVSARNPEMFSILEKLIDEAGAELVASRTLCHRDPRASAK